MNGNGKILFTVFLTIFIDMLGIGVLIPVLPLLILPHSMFRVIPTTWSAANGFVLLGWLATSFPLAQFLCTPILGQLADHFGRKKILAISIAGTAGSYLLFALGIATKNIPLMFVSRIFDGITGGNISVAQAVIADISTPKSRAKNFGLIGMAFGLGFILGPCIGGKLSDASYGIWFNATTPFYFTALLSLINVCLILFMLPETLKLKSSKPLDITRPFHNIIKAFSYIGLRNIMPSTFLYNAGFTFFTTFFAVILADKYGFNQGQIGNYFGYVGIMIVLAQGGLVRMLSGKIADYKVLRFSMFGTGLCLLIYYFIPSHAIYVLYIMPPFLAACNASTMAFNASIVTRVTPENIRGENLGINSSVMALAQAFPAVIAGYVANLHVTFPIIVGSLIATCGGISFWILFKPGQFKHHE